MIEKKEDIVKIINEKGPCLPSQISGQIHLSLLFTSALLSEMVSDKTLKISDLKVGGSPLYFIPGQEEKLENFTKSLPIQEREAVNFLKEKQVIESEKLTPLQRVAFKNAKDFATEVKIKKDNEEKTFWRYYLFSEKEAIEKIKSILENQPKPVPKEKLEVEEKPEIKEEKPEIKEEKKKEVKEEPKEEIEIKKEIKEEKPEIKEEKKKEVKEEPKEEIEKPEIKEEKESKLLHKKVKTRKKKKKTKIDVFREKILEHLGKKKIEVYKPINQENKVCIALVDSDIGLLKFLVYMVNKKTINEADLSLASNEGQEEKLPIMLATQGKLTKKASEYIKKLGNIFLYKF